MDADKGQRGARKKRAQNACQRCRRHKIRCSGSTPCTNCFKRRKTCVFDHVEPTVSVSKRYLSNLERRLASLEQPSEGLVDQSDDTTQTHHVDVEAFPGLQDTTETGTQCPLSNAAKSTFMSQRSATDQTVLVPEPIRSLDRPHSRRPSTEEVQMTNPLSAGPSDSGFISDASLGRSIYLGTSSNWAFSRRVLGGVHQALYGTALAPSNFALDGDVYNLGWDGSRISKDASDKIILPNFDHAVYLVRSVQFHIGQLYHLFHEETFMSDLHEFYESSMHETFKQKLWYIHFLLIVAFGKALVAKGSEKATPYGVEFFVQAMKLLPDVSQLWTDPFTATEIFCCTALYLQSVDFRYGAYVTIGQAVRTSLFQGMHTDMPVTTFGSSVVERARHIWWTVYILDRELSSLMGLPIQTTDDNIHASLPTFHTTEQSAALHLHIKLCRVIAQVVSTVYGPDGRLDKRFLSSTKSALTSIADVAEELGHRFKLTVDEPEAGLSRVAATLHLQYHHAIVLSTRPLLFSLFKKRLEAQHTSFSLVSSMQRLRILLQMCADSTKHSLSILSVLQSQDLLATFVPFDLESAFCSGVIVLMASFVEFQLVDHLSDQLDKTYRILDDLTTRGNMIARLRKSELEQLEKMLNEFQARVLELPDATTNHPATGATLSEAPVNLPPAPTDPPAVPVSSNEFASMAGLQDDWSWEAALDSEQLMYVAGLLDSGQFDSFDPPFNFDD